MCGFLGGGKMLFSVVSCLVVSVCDSVLMFLCNWLWWLVLGIVMMLLCVSSYVSVICVGVMLYVCVKCISFGC